MGAQGERRTGKLAPAVLAGAGIRTLYGHPVGGLPVVTADETLAGLLARAHRAVHHTAAGAVNAHGVIEVPGQTGDPPEVLTLDRACDPAHFAARIRSAARRGGVSVELAVDPGEPLTHVASAGDPGDPWLEDHSGLLERIRRAGSVLVLVGPGVVTSRAVPGLHALAGTLGAGVLNTWGAKGVFHWRSRHHWATVGLQQQDLLLGGIDRADLVLVSGLDDREIPTADWSGYPHAEVEPEGLETLAEALTRRPPPQEMPPLRGRLAAATEAGWEAAGRLLAPSRVTLHYGRALAGGGLVASDAGSPGFWVARTFGTTELGMVAVPPEMWPGWAAACVAVARLADPLRPALAVIENRVDETTGQVVDFARSRGIAVGIEIWTPDGDVPRPEAHELRLREMVQPSPPATVSTLASDPAQMELFIATAGPVVAWAGGLSHQRE